MLSNEQIIGQALDRIEAGYVFPEKVGDIDAAIRRRLAAGEYDGLDGPALCETVTAHLQEVCPDKHLRLLWADQPQSLDPADEDDGRAAFLALLRAENQGIRRVEHLDGNIGLIDVRRIAYADEGAAAIGAAMQLVASARALILDLRACPGGTPEGAAMWCSYFFRDDQVHLNDFYERSTGATRQFWTIAHLPAPRYADRPVHVLTSAKTFSGGEDVAYTLQAHGRASSSVRRHVAARTRRPATRSPNTSSLPCRPPGPSTASPAPTGKASEWSPTYPSRQTRHSTRRSKPQD